MPFERKPRPYSASSAFRMPGYTGHISRVAETISATPAHAQYKAMFATGSEMCPSAPPVKKAGRDPCNQPDKTFKKKPNDAELWPSFNHRPPSAAAGKTSQQKSHIILGDDRYFVKRTQYNDSHADTTSAPGRDGLMDPAVFTSFVNVASSKPALRLGDNIPAVISKKYEDVKRHVSDLALLNIKKNIASRLQSKLACDNGNGRRVLRMFHQFDKNNTGFVEYEEFFQGLASFGIQLTPEEGLRLFAELDTDCNGVICYHIFMSKMVDSDYFALAFKPSDAASNEEGLTAVLAERVQRLKQSLVAKAYQRSTQTSTKNLTTLFLQADSDRSGYIDPPELAALLNGFHIEATPMEIWAFIQSMDQDGDGKVSLKEFQDMLASA